MFKKITYYFWATYRRKLLDKLQKKYSNLYSGIVLDIGGRDRGNFVKPKKNVEKWIFADIEAKHHPDILLDVTNMSQITNESIDTISAIELFEHVDNIEKGINECYRVLKKNGLFIISMPFIYPIHADPYDYQRWTKQKWLSVINGNHLVIVNNHDIGNFFTVLCDMFKNLIQTFPIIIKHVCYLLYPLFDLLVCLDSFHFIKNNDKLNKYTTGYFLILKK